PLDWNEDAFPTVDAVSTTSFPHLDFIEEFIIKFVDTLDPKLNLKARLSAIIGGSLGGHMGLRLSRRVDDYPWIRRIVVWSPISAGPNIYEWAGGPIPGIDNLVAYTLSGPAAASTIRSRAEELEDPDLSRQEYFKTVYDDPTLASWLGGAAAGAEIGVVGGA